ncbi:MAG: phage tail sheath C-terminal domain-containing protein [Bacteroidota bacterium]
MSTFRTPGVYIQEISTLPASIAAVETAIPAFIGYTAQTTFEGESLVNKPTRITSLLDYIERFGGPRSEAFTLTIADSYDGVDGAPATLASRAISASLASPSAYKMYYQLQMFFNNGGGPCYIVSVGADTAAIIPGDANTGTGLLGGLKALEKADEPTLILFPDDMTIASYQAVYDAALAQCEKLKDRFVVMDVKEETTDAVADGGTFRNTGIGADNLKYGAVYYPKLQTTLNYGFDSATLTVTHNNTYIGAGTPNPAVPANGAFNGQTLDTINSTDPSVYRAILVEINKVFADLAPSGAIAGVYARVDNERGVWKAPANVSVRSVIGPTQKITNDDQDTLNIDATSGKSINAIRTFTGRGTLVWGSRTLAGNDNEWRYVPVRRLYIFIEESVKKATEFVVFEPNTANTWLRTKTMIENFLAQLWRDGALAGAVPEDAFFVKVGLGETMTAQDILEGRMNIEIGMAAVRPAEFIILKFSHKLQES